MKLGGSIGGYQGLLQNEYDLNWLVTTVAVNNYVARDRDML